MQLLEPLFIDSLLYLLTEQLRLVYRSRGIQIWLKNDPLSSKYLRNLMRLWQVYFSKKERDLWLGLNLIWFSHHQIGMWFFNFNWLIFNFILFAFSSIYRMSIVNYFIGWMNEKLSFPSIRGGMSLRAIRLNEESSNLAYGSIQLIWSFILAFSFPKWTFMGPLVRPKNHTESRVFLYIFDRNFLRCFRAWYPNSPTSPIQQKIWSEKLFKKYWR